uniref:Uncharacterized protein n=1 Tax=Anguilla anguilla TaxID=7936 RepID=A0A0E9V2G6_ANGAN
MKQLCIVLQKNVSYALTKTAKLARLFGLMLASI